MSLELKGNRFQYRIRSDVSNPTVISEHSSQNKRSTKESEPSNNTEEMNLTDLYYHFIQKLQNMSSSHKYMDNFLGWTINQGSIN